MLSAVFIVVLALIASVSSFTLRSHVDQQKAAAQIADQVLKHVENFGTRFQAKSKLADTIPNEILLAGREAAARGDSVKSAVLSRNGQAVTPQDTSLDVGYVGITLRDQLSCSADVNLAVSFGTNLCMPIVGTNGIKATKLTYDSLQLNQHFYLDSQCTEELGVGVLMSIGLNLDECLGGVTVSHSSTCDLPNQVGRLVDEFVDYATCNDGAPFQRIWVSEDNQDDNNGLLGIILHDDHIHNVDIDEQDNCVERDVSGIFGIGLNIGILGSIDDVLSDLGDLVYDAVPVFRVSTTTKVSTDDDNGAASCFAGSEMVSRLSQDGVENVAISEIQLGDRVLASDFLGNLKYSSVIAVPHPQDNVVTAKFAHIVTASGNADVKMTPNHIVVVKEHCDMSEASALLPAAQVQPGMCVLSTQNNAAVLDEVVEVSITSGVGIHTIVTEEEFVVVGGLVASPFADNHATGHAYYNVIRAMNKVGGNVMEWSVVQQANLLFGALATSVQGL